MIGHDPADTLITILRDEEALPEQGSEEWLRIRKSLVTASIASDILGKKKKLETFYQQIFDVDHLHLKLTHHFQTRRQIIEHKLNIPSGCKQSLYSQWIMKQGVRQEALIRQHLERIAYSVKHTDVYIPLKFRVHENWLAASPDGCFMDPIRLLEIKSIHGRKPIMDHIPEKYWIQIQIQLFVYKIQTAQYSEVQLEFFPTYGEWLMAPHPHKYCAYIDDETDRTFYPPPNQHNETWHNEVAIYKALEGLEIVYYAIKFEQTFKITAQPGWIQSILPTLYEFYLDLKRQKQEVTSSDLMQVEAIKDQLMEECNL